MASMSRLAGAVRRLATVRTSPNSTVTVRGDRNGGNVTLCTNYESHVATVEGTREGAPADVAVRAGSSEGDFIVDITDGVDVSIGIPASFNVDVDRRGARSDARLQGWLEGLVAVRTDAGEVAVDSVRGPHTRLSSGRGDVQARLIDGNATLVALGGAVAVDKMLGAVVALRAVGGDVSAKALYADRVAVSTDGSLHLGFFHAAEADLHCMGSDVVIKSVDGSARLVWCGSGNATVQLSDKARALHLEADYGDVVLRVPPGLAVDGKLTGPAVSVRLGAVDEQWPLENTLDVLPTTGVALHAEPARPRQAAGSDGWAELRAVATRGSLTVARESWLGSSALSSCGAGKRPPGR